MVIKELLTELGWSPLANQSILKNLDIAEDVYAHVQRTTEDAFEDMDMGTEEFSGLIDQLVLIGHHLAIGLFALGKGAPTTYDIQEAIEKIAHSPYFLEELRDRVPCVNILAAPEAMEYDLGAIEAFGAYYHWLSDMEDSDDLALEIVDEVLPAEISDSVPVHQFPTNVLLQLPMTCLRELSQLKYTRNVNISIIGSQLILSGDIIEVSSEAISVVETALDNLTSDRPDKHPYTLGAYDGVLKFTLTL
jgi:hypothetical protein